MRVFRSRPVTRVLSAAFAVLIAGSPVLAAPAPVEARVEPAPPAPVTALPLRPGELVVPTAGGACSVVVFAPEEERFNRMAAYWRTAVWTGGCRFGLAHGAGEIAALDGSWRVPTAMLYGTEVNPAEVTQFETGPDGAVAWTSVSGTLNFFSGPAFNDLTAARYVIRLDRKPARELDLGDLAADWYGNDYLERHTFDLDGREQVMSVSVLDVATYCGLGLPEEFEAFDKEMKKACKKAGTKLVLLRREGPASDLWVDRPITWLKSCPYSKSRKIDDCGALVRSALIKEADLLESFLTEGDSAARAAAEQEIIARYAPLEAAYAESVLVKAED